MACDSYLILNDFYMTNSLRYIATIGRRVNMGKHTFEGLATSWDQIPVATSIMLDHNLRKNLSRTSTQHTKDKVGHGGKQKQKGAHLKNP
jgi:hypothetical protein